MLYEVINQDGKVMAGTTYKSCIYPMDLMIRMNENGWRFRIDGKLVPKTNFKSSMEQAIANAVCEHGTEYNPDGDEPSEKKPTPAVHPVQRTRRGGKVRCIDNGKINVNPFSGIRLRRGEKNVQFLTEEEVAKIRTTDFHNESLNRVRDLFVFQAASGLSYTDMVKLVPEDFQQAPNGMYYIHDTRNKTGVYYTSVILDDGVDVLRKYDFRLPMISNQKTNSYLKVIRDICGIDKPIFSHVARHTYATRCLNRGIRLEVVAKLLGHSTTKLTQHYAKLLDNSILAEVDEAFTKLKTDGDKK